MEIARQLLSVLLVFALLGAGLWALRRGSAGSFRAGFLQRTQRPGRSLESIERLALTPQHALHLVRLHGREVVVSTHPQGCALLTEINRGASE